MHDCFMPVDDFSIAVQSMFVPSWPQTIMSTLGHPVAILLYAGLHNEPNLATMYWSLLYLSCVRMSSLHCGCRELVAARP
eukprot:2354504-Amphidinium_carterae.1